MLKWLGQRPKPKESEQETEQPQESTVNVAENEPEKEEEPTPIEELIYSPRLQKKKSPPIPSAHCLERP